MRPGGPSRPRRAQLRTRVLAGVLLITLVALVAFDIAAVTALRGYLLGQTDSQLQNVLSLYRPLNVSLPVSPPGQALHSPPGRPPPKLSGPFQQRLAIVGPRLRLPSILGEYNVVFVSGHGPRKFVEAGPDLVPRLPVGLPDKAVGLPDKAVGLPDKAVGLRAQTVPSRNGYAQLRLQAVREAGGALVVTTSLAGVNRTVGRLELILTVGSLAAGLLVALGVAWVARRGLRPIETMAAQADRITAGDLTDRVSPHDAATEVGRLGTALNGMLARIEAAVHEREASQELTRRFFADASHELRNPLASLRANAELYQQGALPDRPHVDEAMRRIALEAQRMSGLVDDMLGLARLDQHPGRQHDPVDLGALARECAERAHIADPVRTWQAHIAADLMITGDEELLRRAIDNLLANVRAHTPAGTRATITAAGHGSTVTVEVSDDGPGVPASQLPCIFDRFYRAAAPSHRPGSGLGLSIVTAIAAAHDGTALATLNQPRGLRMTLTLPACSQILNPPGQDQLSGSGE